MAKRLLRPNYPLGGISWDDYQLIARALYKRQQNGAGPLERGETLTVDGERPKLSERWITLTPSDPLGRLVDARNAFATRISAAAAVHSGSTTLELTQIGHALVKHIERNGLGTGLLAHTASAPSWREAQLAELAVRMAKTPGEALIPLPTLRWWLGIEGRYPRLANIFDAILERLQPTPLALRVIEAQEQTGFLCGFVMLTYAPPENAGDQDMLVSPHSEAALALAKQLGIPAIAAAVMLEDASTLRPDYSRDEIMTALAQ